MRATTVLYWNVRLTSGATLRLLSLVALAIGPAACGDDAVIGIPESDIQVGTDQDVNLADVDAVGVDGGPDIAGQTDAQGELPDNPDVAPGTDVQSGEDADAQTGADGDAQVAADADAAVQTDSVDPADAVSGDVAIAPDTADAEDSATAVDAQADALPGDIQTPDDALVIDDTVIVLDIAPGEDATTTVDAGPVACTTGTDCVGDLAACQAWACEEGQCVAGAAADGTTCADGDACTTLDTCVAGVCTGGTNVCTCATDGDCADGNDCTTDTCSIAKTCEHANNTAACSDGDLCSTGDVCADGTCTTQKTSCDDNNLCTDDACDPTSGNCAYTNNSGPCQDDSACTAGDACSGGGCVSGATVECGDDNLCTDDSCVKETGCVNLANAVTCDDGDNCTIGDVCATSKCAGTLNTCDDNNVCTADVCDQATGGCQYNNIAVDCEDGNVCTTDDSCKSGVCTPGVAKICNDANACTADACDPTTGNCLKPPVAGPCEDGDVCTLSDTCADGACTPGTPQVCDDGKPCTDDICNSTLGCQTTNNTAPCSPTGICEIGVCTAGACVTTGQIGCNDGNPCTTDSCDTSLGCVTTNVGDGVKCADGNACVTDSLCAAGQCATGTVTDCTDDKPCTNDSCDPVNGCTWLANTAACDDKDACTTGDICKNGVCKGPTAVDPLVSCNDNNPCTNDTCDPAIGCVHTNNTDPCDDSSLCTSADVCTGGSCVGTAKTCDDTNVCTTDSCTPATGDCVFDPNQAACDDGNACTSGDLCANSACTPGSAKTCDDTNACTDDVCDTATGICGYTNNAGPCNDGNPCTSGDTCAGGTCSVSTAATCDDANGCTTDACDISTGDCTYTDNANPCDTGDKCTFGDTCGGGTCVKGTSQVCNDNNVCTTDSCDSTTGQCTFAAVTNGGACDDGIDCTTNSCQAGKCATTASTCTLFTDNINCADAGAGWTIVKTPGKTVVWAVDQTPVIGSGAEQTAHGCTLNYNDGTDYCDPVNNGFCTNTTGTASSPVIDATAAFGVVTLKFDSWVDVDTSQQAGAETPTVTLVDATSGATLASFTLSTSPANSNTWRSLSVAVNGVSGHQFKVVFTLPGATVPFQGVNYSFGDLKKGWFVDNITVLQATNPEVCNDSLDNDGDGLTDCTDPNCAADSACNVEICNDGVDNDKDDVIDCADTSCANSVYCATPIATWNMDCGSTGWTFSQAVANNVAWAIDATPVAPAPVTGSCSLNFNNGTNYCRTTNCGNSNNQAPSGTAVMTDAFNATAYKSGLTLQFWHYMDVEDPAGNGGATVDLGYLDISTNNFACQFGNFGCPSQFNPYTATASVAIPKTPLKTWIQSTLDLSALAGQSFKLRFRFDSVDNTDNNHAGLFIDDIKLFGW